MHLGKCSFEESCLLNCSALRKRGACRLWCFNESTRLQRNLLADFRTEHGRLALLGRAEFIVCMVMQMSLGNIDASWALADVGKASLCLSATQMDLGQGLHCSSPCRFSYTEHSISLRSLVSLSADNWSTHKIPCLDWGFSTLMNTSESLTLTKYRF